MVVRGSSAGALAVRSLHLKLNPMPRTFPERREVLRVLERFGEVAMFKSLKYEPGNPTPDAFLSLFTTESAAQDLLNASPIRYRLIAETATATETETETEKTVKVEASPISPTQTQEQDTTIFELTASPARLNHDKYIRDPFTNPLYGPFKPIATDRSSLAAALAPHLPRSLAASGLQDWETAGLRWRSEEAVLEAGGSPGTSTGNTGIAPIPIDPSPAFMASKRIRERLEKNTPRVMRGLQALVAERGKKMMMKKEVEEGEEGEAKGAKGEIKSPLLDSTIPLQ